MKFVSAVLTVLAASASVGHPRLSSKEENGEQERGNRSTKQEAMSMSMPNSMVMLSSEIAAFGTAAASETTTSKVSSKASKPSKNKKSKKPTLPHTTKPTVPAGRTSSKANKLPTTPAPTVKPTTPLPNVPLFTLQGFSETAFNPVAGPVCITIEHAKFLEDQAKVNFTINDNTVSVSHLNATMVCADQDLDDGKNEIVLGAIDTTGAAMAFDAELWAGTNSILVNLESSPGVAYAGAANVTAQLSDNNSVQATKSAPNAVVEFHNLPTRTILFTAKGENNEIGSSGAVGGDAGSTKIVLKGFGDPSPVDNNDFSKGLAGWAISDEDLPYARIENHQENVGPPNPLLGNSGSRRRHLGFFSDEGPQDMDLCLYTEGVWDGERLVERVYDAPAGTTIVNLRYRFVTSEVPNGYFGSQYNDYYRVSLRSQKYGDTVTEFATMNGLGLEAFDYDSGETRWGNLWLALDPSGDRVAIDAAVANVADDIYDSMVCLDLAEEWECSIEMFQETMADEMFSDVWEAGRTLAEEAKQTAIDAGLFGGRNGSAGAFHHCYWSCRMTQNMGAEKAAQVGDLHEECAQSGTTPQETDMDLFNDGVGRNLATGPEVDCSVSCQTALANNQLRLLQEDHSFNVVVVGGGTGGAAAAIEAARHGHSVALLEETDWLGGQMSAAGVTGMDENANNQKSGFYADFLEAMRGYYNGPGSGIFPSCGTSLRKYSMETCLGAWRDPALPDWYCFEPSVAQCVLTEMVKAANGVRPVQVFYRTTITNVESHPFKDDHLNKDRTRVVGVNAVQRKPNGLVQQHFFSAKFTIDATETGDVLELGPAEFRLANMRGTTESLKGQLENSCVQYITYVGVIKQYPNVLDNDLLIQSEPPGYTEEVKELFRKLVTNDGAMAHFNWIDFLNYRGMPDSKGDLIDPGKDARVITRSGINLYTDLSDGNDVEIEADLSSQSREKAACDGKLRTIQFLYYIQHELEHRDWSVADDEGYNKTFNNAYDHCSNIPDDLALIESHLPAMPYVREGRRIVGLYDLKAKEIRREKVCESSFCKSEAIRETRISSTPFKDALVVGDYAVDLHGCNKDSDLEWYEFGETWADVPPPADWSVRGPFQVPFGSFIPKEVDGLLMAEKNLAVSRLVNGAIRLQPITMLTGQVAGAIAHLSLKHTIQPRYLSSLMVQRHMLSLGNKGRLALRTFIDVDRASPHWADVQLVATRGIMVGSLNNNGDLQFLGDNYLTREEVAAVVCKTFDISSTEPLENTFEDVPTDRWSFGCIEALAEREIVKGKVCQVPVPTGKPSFCPTEDVTRAELATVLTLAYGKEATENVLPPFYSYEDVNLPENKWAFNFTHLATKYGWMEACSPNNFCPKAPVKRFDTAKIIMDPGKVLDDLEERKMDA